MADYARIARVMRDRGWVDFDDATVAERFRTTVVRRPRAIPRLELLRFVAAEGRADRIVRGQTGHPDENVRAVCIAAERMFLVDDATLDPENPADVALIEALVTASPPVLTPADMQALRSLATEVVGIIETEGVGGVVLPGHVAKARRHLVVRSDHDLRRRRGS
jgi:hypothetical protein